MAECTTYSSIQVIGAGFASADGTYFPYSTGNQSGNIYTIWTKDSLDSYPRISASGSGLGQWSILSNIPYPGASIYITPADSVGSSDCPVGLTWSTGPFGTDPAPIVTGTLVAVEASSTFKVIADTNVKIQGKVKIL